MLSRLLLLSCLCAAAPVTAQTADTAPRAAAHGNGSAADSVVPAPPASDTVRARAGVYSETQALLGEKAFSAYCASCHTREFHSGEQFRFAWFGRSVYDLFKVLKTTMPEDNIGGLSDDDYTRVIAYILKLNGFPAGADSLRADSTAMRRIRIGAAGETQRGDTTPPNRR